MPAVKWRQPDAGTGRPVASGTSPGGAGEGRSDETSVWGKRGRNPPPRVTSRTNPGTISSRATEIFASM